MADLDTLLATAPAGSKDAAAKQTHADQVFQALDKIADSKIDLTIDAMTPDAGKVVGHVTLSSSSNVPTEFQTAVS